MTTKDDVETSGSVDALLGAATLAERLLAARIGDHFTSKEIDALRLLARHARESAAQAAELEAWKRLAIARIPLSCPTHEEEDAWCRERDAARDALRAMGIDHATGDRVATQEPR